ncbi:signal peptidase I [Candidatus Bathyarchaeota archaeon]|nr:signal peptidase I [Candidatus Bathyarchaeota archaeon]
MRLARVLSAACMASASSLSALLALMLSKSGIPFQRLFPYVGLMGATIGGLLYLGLDCLLRDGRSIRGHGKGNLSLPGEGEILINESDRLVDDRCSDHEGQPLQKKWRMIIMRTLKVGILLLSALEAYLLLAFTFGSLTPLFVVPSNSMSPTLSLGDLVLVRGADPASLGVGDIIVFDVPPPHDRYTLSPVIHRVVDMRVENDRLHFKTKGDGLQSVDPWSLPAERVRGIYAFKIPYLGAPLLFLRTPIGLAISAILLLLWILYPAGVPAHEQMSAQWDREAQLRI